MLAYHVLNEIVFIMNLFNNIQFLFILQSHKITKNDASTSTLIKRFRYMHGTQYWVIGLSYPFVLAATAHLYLPVYYKFNFSGSAHEYIVTIIK